jgi:hypothetical protein
MDLPVASPFVFVTDVHAHAYFDAGFRVGTLRAAYARRPNNAIEVIETFGMRRIHAHVVADFVSNEQLLRRQMIEISAIVDYALTYPDSAEDLDPPNVIAPYRDYYFAGLEYGQHGTLDEEADEGDSWDDIIQEVAVMKLRKHLAPHQQSAEMEHVKPENRAAVIELLLEDPAFQLRMELFDGADSDCPRLPHVFAAAMRDRRVDVTWDYFRERLHHDEYTPEEAVVLLAIARNNGFEATPDQIASIFPDDAQDLDEFVDKMRHVPPWFDALAALRWHPTFTRKVLLRWIEGGMAPDLTGLAGLFVDPESLPSMARRAVRESCDAAVDVLPDFLTNGAPVKDVYEATKRDPRARKIVHTFLLHRDRSIAQCVQQTGFPVDLARRIRRLQGHRWA